jgi:hypothetical protein
MIAFALTVLLIENIEEAVIREALETLLYSGKVNECSFYKNQPGKLK